MTFLSPLAHGVKLPESHPPCDQATPPTVYDHSLWARHYGKHLSVLSHVIVTSALRVLPIPSNLMPPTKEETGGWSDEVIGLMSHGQSLVTEGLEPGLLDTEAVLLTTMHCPLWTSASSREA